MTTPQLCVAFPLGQALHLEVEFTRPPTDEELADGTAADADDWQFADPDEVRASVVRVVNGEAVPETLTQHAYLDSPSDIVRDEVGKYHLAITPELANTGRPNVDYWAWKFEGTGAVTATTPDGRFIVTPSVFE